MMEDKCMGYENILYDYLGIEKSEVHDNDFRELTLESKEDYVNTLLYFIQMNHSFYMDEGIMLHVINDSLLNFKEIFKWVFPLYEHAKKNNYLSWVHYLGDYILKCQFSLESKVYANLENRNETLRELYSFFERKSFYSNGDLVQCSLDYYHELKDRYEFGGLKYQLMKVDAVLPILSSRAKDNSQYCQLFDYYLNNFNNVYSLIRYDYDVSSHKLEYCDDLEKRLKQTPIDYHYVKKLLKALDPNVFGEKENCLVLGELIKDINQFLHSIKMDQMHVIDATAKVDNFLLILDYFKNHQNFYANYSEKINECIQRVLYGKRWLIKNTDYTKAFQSSSFKISDEVKTIVIESISSDFSNLYYFLVSDCDNLLEEEIKQHSEHPIRNLCSHVNIIQEQGVYRDADELEKHAISEYYNRLGKRLVNKLSSELMNVYSGDCYLLLMRGMSMKHDISLSTVYKLNEKLFENQFVDYLFTNILDTGDSETFSNKYAISTGLIISCEQLIYEIMCMLNLKEKYKMSPMSANLNEIFKEKENDSDFRDVLVYVNYVLYSNKGMNLRNDMMHGNLIHRDVTKELICVYVCLLGLIKLRGKIEL